MKICKSIASLLLCIAAVLRLLPVQVLAAGNINLSRKGNLTITDSYDETGLSGVIFHIYRISAVDEYGKLTPTTDFRKYADQLDICIEKNEGWIEIAKTLEQDILLSGSPEPTASAVSDENGIATFSDLELGLYLVIGTSIEKGEYLYSTGPFMVMFPNRDSDSNTWVYSVNAVAKTDRQPTLIDIEVVKIWKDDCHRNQRPQSISVMLLCDGEPYGESITLPHNGQWKYTWHDLEANHRWTVEEETVVGYQAPDIQRNGNTFFIRNVCGKPGASLPQTGLLWWPVPVLTACGLLCIVAGLIRRKGSVQE